MRLFSGIGTYAKATGLYARTELNYLGTLTNAYGIRTKISNTNASGTITNAYGIYVASNVTAGTLTNNYGLYIETQTGIGATLNYALYIAGGESRFKDKVVIDSSLTVNGSGSYTGSLSVGKAFSLPVRVVDDNYTATSDDYTIICNRSSGAMQVDLPAAAGCAGRIYVVKNITAQTVVVDANGTETIDGSLTVSISTQWNALTIQSNGTNWVILSNKN
jgi:hypothetical protein